MKPLQLCSEYFSGLLLAPAMPGFSAICTAGPKTFVFSVAEGHVDQALLTLAVVMCRHSDGDPRDCSAVIGVPTVDGKALIAFAFSGHAKTAGAKWFYRTKNTVVEKIYPLLVAEDDPLYKKVWAFNPITQIPDCGTDVASAICGLTNSAVVYLTP
jgi:hypothetical protein